MTEEGLDACRRRGERRRVLGDEGRLNFLGVSGERSIGLEYNKDFGDRRFLGEGVAGLELRGGSGDES